jgi:hypothetical protein
MNKISRLLLINLLVIKISVVQAQNYSISKTDYWYNYIVSDENRQMEKNRTNHLKEKLVLDKKRPSNNITYKYDENGRVINYKNRKSEVRSDYVHDLHKRFIAFYKKGKLVELDSFYWEGNNLKACKVFDKNSKLFKRELYKHDSSYVTEYLFERRKQGKMIEMRKNIYEYYPDYSFKKITYYKKGKPHYFTVFDCDPLGKNQKIKKDSSYHCVKYDIDSLGNKVKVTVTNSKGISWKVLEYLNSKDECIARKTYDLKQKEELMWAYFFNPGTMHMTRFISYKNSKEHYRIENIYDENGNCIETLTYKSGFLKEKGVNRFNEKGLITSTVKFNTKGRKKEEINYEYQYY